ncbi:peptidase M14 [Paenibacillus sambharensis]|uniref:Peptidase M14 n=1 Tax=Paenibacillus sambharensis TaxID=1803190 RepID=A0A2W1LAK6_9BACL|nr:M14 family metallopeptidase [Paenibacillus sambharensis]PZD95923.1 peptidase M14 [Paenibacillus sambharensis]
MFRYIVQPGDTVLRIAKMFHLHGDAIYTANPHISSANHLSPGLVLSIPTPEPQQYCIQQGDTMMGIARMFGVPVNRIMALNPYLNPQALLPGQLVTIPPGMSGRIVEANEEYGPRQLVRDLGRLKALYPFLEIGEYGSSVLGQPLCYIRLGTGKRRIHVNAAFHANEWITSLVAMTCIEDLARALSLGETYRGFEPEALLRRCQLVVAPMVNPDGVELAQQGVTPSHPYYESLLKWNRYSPRFFRWKSNIRGVDLNDQFPAHWEEECARRGTEGPGPRDYPGTAPLSEPEAAAIAELARREQFDVVLALHTQGQEIYWNYRDMEPPGTEQLAARLGMVSGYRPVKLTGSDAGYKDWFIQEFRRPGFTIEAGYGVNPLPLSQFADIYDEMAPLLLEVMTAE